MSFTLQGQLLAVCQTTLLFSARKLKFTFQAIFQRKTKVKRGRSKNFPFLLANGQISVCLF